MACWRRTPSCGLWGCHKGRPLRRKSPRRAPRPQPPPSAKSRPSAASGRTASAGRGCSSVSWLRHDVSTSGPAPKLRFRHRHAARPGLRRRRAHKVIAAIHERPVVEKMLTHLGLDPQPPPKGRARETRHDQSRPNRAGLRGPLSAGCAAPPPRRPAACSSAVRHVGSTRQDSGSILGARPKPSFASGHGSAEPGQRECADTKHRQFMPPQPDPRAALAR